MVNGRRKELLVAELVVRDHHLLSGLAAKLGGADEGPDPHELVEAALAACTILTAQLYANRKGWKLESTDATVKIVEEGAATKIAREVSFRGDLTDDERNRLLQIVNMCPIHKLLESNITIQTTVTPTQRPPAA